MKVHLIGIGGTGMGAVAGLLAAAGHDVRGSDTAVYPPMSEQLAALGIPVFTGFAAANLDWAPDLVVVGNVNTKDHIEVVAAQQRGLTLTSFPAVLGEQLLADRHSIVVTGTHGKTTTTSVLAHLLVEAGRDPGLFVGGVPIALGQGWRLGRGPDFVVEGDEYDTAFFDKGSKFLHYRPRTAILTSVELDHVDIFPSFDAVRDAFKRFVALIPDDGLLVVSCDSAEAMEVAAGARCRIETYAVVDDGSDPHPDATWCAHHLEYQKSGRVSFEVVGRGESLGRFETLLVGRHNVGNVLAAIAVAIDRGVQVEILRRAVGSFAGVRRRQELRGIAGGVWVFDDYAHHPTAVRETLRALRRRFPKRRLIAAYEPRSATSRRRTFQQEFVAAFSHADEVVVGKLYDPQRIPREERFDPERMALDLHRGGTKATYLAETDAMVKHLASAAGPGDVVVVLSSGSFDGLHDKLLDAIGDPVVPARRGDMPAIREMLTSVGLPIDEASDEQAGNFFYLRNELGIAGVVALPVLGEDAILHSLAVALSVRGAGYGWMLADVAVQWARQRGCRRIYLLTQTASDFFAAKLGFRVVDRSTVSLAVSDTWTFRSSTDQKFVAMRLDLWAGERIGEQLDEALAIARAVGDEAAQLLRGARATEVRSKADPTDLVTEWDTRTEDLIRARLAVLTPDIPMIGEEGGGATSGRRWVVDPIDGTVNFAHGLPIWAVSIGLEGEDGGEVGVVTAPALGWTFWARRGGGAFARRGDLEERVQVSAVAALGKALLVTGFPYDRATSPDNNFAEWEHLQRLAGACRRLGAASLDLCLVATGSFDGYWERKLKPWDVAAGALIVAEAGGRVTDTRGGPFTVTGGDVIASNGAIHDGIVAELAVVARRKERA